MPFFHVSGTNDFKVRLNARIKPKCVFLTGFSIFGAPTTAGVPDDIAMFLEITEVPMDFNEQNSNQASRGLPLLLTGANTTTQFSPPLLVGQGSGEFQDFRIRVLTSSGALATISRCAFSFSY
jgi:hypothetical protein